MRSPLHLILGALLVLVNASDAAAQDRLRLESEQGDTLGQGNNRDFDAGDGDFSASVNSDGGVSIEFDGNQDWTLDFAAAGDVPLVPGLYPNALRIGTQAIDENGMEIAGDGRSCGTLRGQFDVIEVVYGGGGTTVTQFAADFVQYCGNSTKQLVGSIRFNATPGLPLFIDDDEDTIPDVADNCPGLSNEDQDDTDGDGIGNDCDPCLQATFVVIDGDSADVISEGDRRRFYPGNAEIIGGRNVNDGVSFSIDGDEDWFLDFSAPGDAPLEPGKYDDATLFPFNGNNDPGIDIAGDGRSCESAKGSFEVYEAEYDGDGNLLVFSADFTQKCDDASAALRGNVRYLARFIPIKGDQDGDSVRDENDNHPGKPNPSGADSDGIVCQLDARQQKCVNRMNSSGAKLLKLQNKSNLTCLKNAAAGKTDKLGTPATAQDCLTNDVSGKTAKSVTKLDNAAAADCENLEDVPAFGFDSAEAISDASLAQGVGVFDDLFGPNLDAAVIPTAADKPGAKCQATLAQRTNAVVDTLFSKSVKHKKSLIAGKVSTTPPPRSSEELADGILDYLDGDAANSIEKKEKAIENAATKTCRDVPNLDAVFPGCDESDPLDLSACATKAARCRFCTALNAYDALTIDCDLFDDEVDDASCP
jgi:hypothetical protein